MNEDEKMARWIMDYLIGSGYVTLADPTGSQGAVEKQLAEELNDLVVDHYCDTCPDVDTRDPSEIAAEVARERREAMYELR